MSSWKARLVRRLVGVSESAAVSAAPGATDTPALAPPCSNGDAPIIPRDPLEPGRRRGGVDPYTSGRVHLFPVPYS